MKIGHLAGKAPAPPSVTHQPAAPHPAHAAAASAVGGGAAASNETVALAEPSSTADVAGAGGRGPTFDAAKVARLRARIASGTFRIDADAIADKLIAKAPQRLRGAGR
jgi:negative regulator of flagellin synthesis FlgM